MKRCCVALSWALMDTVFFFGCKIGARNFKKLFTYQKGPGHYAPNPVFEG